MVFSESLVKRRHDTQAEEKPERLAKTLGNLKPAALKDTLLHKVGEENPEKLEETLSNYVRKAPGDTLANKLEVRIAEAFGNILSDVKANTL